MVVSTNTKTLDHIVHLTPPGSVEQASTQFKDLGFKVIPGGTHTDGLTANALVVLKDGVYIELIAFLHPVSYYPPGSPEREEREKHYWATKPPGWIDFAFLGNGSLVTRISDVINQRAEKQGAAVRYDAEEAGGRIRPDGQLVEWLVTDPPQKCRGILPFFCGDVTPRRLRVPLDPPSNTDHPSTVRGVAHLRALCDHRHFAELSRDITTVLGISPLSSHAGKAKWLLDTTVATGNPQRPNLILSCPVNDEEVEFVRQLAHERVGIFEVAFLVDSGRERKEGKTPYGKIVWIPEFA